MSAWASVAQKTRVLPGSDGSIRSAGVVSDGDGTCIYEATFTRTDMYRDWLESIMGPIEPPGPPPYIRLEAPSGAIWEWQEPSDEECVRGSAVDFCHVVTQGRNVADTALDVRGPVATSWMAIAQCFAGGPVDPPAPGTRGPKG